LKRLSEFFESILMAVWAGIWIAVFLMAGLVAMLLAALDVVILATARALTIFGGKR